MKKCIMNIAPELILWTLHNLATTAVLEQL